MKIEEVTGPFWLLIYFQQYFEYFWDRLLCLLCGEYFEFLEYFEYYFQEYIVMLIVR